MTTKGRKTGRRAVLGATPDERTAIVAAAALVFGCIGCTTGSGGDSAPGARPPAGADGASGTVAAALATADSSVAASSDVLALLPDGDEKRRFILDCTGCHQFDAARAFADGAARTEAEWLPIVRRMLQFGGVSGPSPLISPERDAAATASWLAANLAAPPEPRPALASPTGAEITSYMYPHAGDLAHDIAVESDGDVIVTGMFTHQMMRLDPDAGPDGTWSTVAIPVGGANPRAIEIDPAGNWWVLLGTPGKIARYRPSPGSWDTWDIGMYGHSLRLDGEGRLWFNGHFTRHPSIFGVLDPAAGGGGGVVETFEVPERPPAEPAHPMPYGLRVADDGTVWGTELRGNRLFAYSPESRETAVHVLPGRHSGPRRLAIDPAGAVWIPEYAGNRLTRFDPQTEQFRSYELPLPDALPYVAEFDRGRNLVWLGTAAADVLLSFDPTSERFTAYAMPTEGAMIRHLVVDEARGDVWAVYGAFPGIAPRLVRIRP